MILYTVIACIFLAVDRITKYVSLIYCTKEDYVFNSFLHATYLLNPGVSYGFLTPTNTLYFWALTIAICFINTGLLFYWFRYRNTYNSLSFGLFLINIGSLSNIIDRVLYKGVIDWIYIHYEKYSFAVFNVADIYICIGGLLVLYTYAKE